MDAPETGKGSAAETRWAHRAEKSPRPDEESHCRAVHHTCRASSQGCRGALKGCRGVLQTLRDVRQTCIADRTSALSHCIMKMETGTLELRRAEVSCGI